HLAYESRPDAMVSYRRGWAVTNALRLTTVDVTSKTFEGSPSSPRELVRRYHLTYDPAYHVSLLASLQTEGKCAPATNPVESDGMLASSTGCPVLPAMTFHYQHVGSFNTKGEPTTPDLVGYEGFDERIHAMSGSPSH